MNRQISMTEKKISVPLKIVIFKKKKKKVILWKTALIKLQRMERNSICDEEIAEGLILVPYQMWLFIINWWI